MIDENNKQETTPIQVVELSASVTDAIFDKAIVSEAYGEANREGIQEEEEVIARMQEIATDAKLETPVTETGRVVREKALKAVEDAKAGIPSPYAPKIEFDYKKYRDETTGVALAQAFQILAKYNLIAKQIETQEQKDELNKAYGDCSLELFKLFNETKTPIKDYGYFFKCLGYAITMLENIVDQQVQGHRTEVLSRLLESKNPGSNKYDSGFGTYANLTDLLGRARKATGDRMDDYFDME